jgi:hypothetical protein
MAHVSGRIRPNHTIRIDAAPLGSSSPPIGHFRKNT